MAIGKWAKKKSSQATKAAGKRYGVSVGRRGVRFSKNSMSKIAKDVMMIKSQLNVEKKFIDKAEITEGSVGQVRDQGDGYYEDDITPAIAQGVAEQQRVGNSLKLTGMVLKLFLKKQAQAEGTRRVRFYVVRCLDRYVGDVALTGASVHGKILDPNPFCPVRDYNSNLDYTQFKDGRMRILLTRDVVFGQNNSDSLTIDSELMTKSITLALKLNDILRFETNGDALPENIRYKLIAVADGGNAGGTQSQVLGASSPTPLSAIDFKVHSRFWYVDN